MCWHLIQKKHCSKIRTLSQDTSQRAAYSSVKIWPQHAATPSKHTQAETQSGGGSRSLRAFNVWRTYCLSSETGQFSFKFLQVMSWPVHNFYWVPLFSVLCIVATQLPMAGEVMLGEHSDPGPCLPCCDPDNRVWALAAWTKSNFHNAFWVTCPWLMHLLKERDGPGVERLTDWLCLLPNRWNPKISTETEEAHIPAVFPSPRIYIFQL